jgi:hypothetical protein
VPEGLKGCVGYEVDRVGVLVEGQLVRGDVEPAGGGEVEGVEGGEVGGAVVGDGGDAKGERSFVHGQEVTLSLLVTVSHTIHVSTLLSTNLHPPTLTPKRI